MNFPGCCPARERRTSRTSPNGFGHADLSITSQAGDPGLRLWLSSNHQSHLRRNCLHRSDKSRACSIYCDANVKWISAATSINYSPTTKSAPPKRLAKLSQDCSHTAVDKMALRCPPTPASFSQVVSPSSMCRASSVKTTPLIWEVSSGWKKKNEIFGFIHEKLLLNRQPRPLRYHDMYMSFAPLGEEWDVCVVISAAETLTIPFSDEKNVI